MSEVRVAVQRDRSAFATVLAPSSREAREAEQCDAEDSPEAQGPLDGVIWAWHGAPDMPRMPIFDRL